jgi:hypothetical protein
VFYAIKAEICDPDAETFVFTAQKTMYGGKCIAAGDKLFLFASENEGGKGLIAFGIVARATAVPKKQVGGRETPRVNVWATRLSPAKGQLGRNDLKPFTHWNDGQPATELNFKFYRQATNKIVAISDQTAAFLEKFF